MDYKLKNKTDFISSAKNALLISTLLGLLAGCAAVKPYEREKLSDPLIEPKNQTSKQSLDQKFFTSREGSIGGSDGIGGGCGCAK